jgi:hypothetical protein
MEMETLQLERLVDDPENRATAETADYVFSKRTIKPKMQLVNK